MPSNYHDGHDIFLVKISMITGDTIWQKCYGGTGEDIIYDVTTDLNGEIIVVGSTNSTDGDMDTVCYGQKML